MTASFLAFAGCLGHKTSETSYCCRSRLPRRHFFFFRGKQTRKDKMFSQMLTQFSLPFYLIVTFEKEQFSYSISKQTGATKQQNQTKSQKSILFWSFWCRKGWSLTKKLGQKIGNCKVKEPIRQLDI